VSWDYAPLMSEWRRGKALRRCECTDASGRECMNMDVESICVHGDEVCGCGCHNARLLSTTPGTPTGTGEGT